MSETFDYPGQADDQHRRAIGASIFGHLVDRGVVDPPPPPEETGPSAMDNLLAMKRARQVDIAQTLFGAYATAYGAEIPLDREPEAEPPEEER